MASRYSGNPELLNSAVLNWMHASAQQGILLTDETLTIVGWNHWLEEATGRLLQDAIGKNLLELYPELAERGLDDCYHKALQGQPSVLSHRLHNYLLRIPLVSEFREHDHMQQRARISPLVHDGGVIGTFTVIEDVTERVERESQLQAQLEARSKLLASEKSARHEAEEANRLKDEFLATISHELRTPLSAIIGWANLLRSRELDAAMTARAVETIHRNARSQTQLISDLLDVSRITSNKLLLSIDTMDLPSVVKTAMEGVERDADAKQITLRTTIPADFPGVPGDPERIQQIIWNLLTNAIKFTPDGGVIRVTLDHSETTAKIIVADSGMGIEPEFLPHVFDRFRQANSGITRTHGGLGLGLAIVRQLSELHGGTAEVRSDGEGKGATFVISLPLGGARRRKEGDLSKDKISWTEARKALDGLRILVVEDDTDTIDFLKEVLKKCGCRVTTASTVSAAMAIFNKERPDFLISDLGMPDEDGYSLIRRIRALPLEAGGQTPAAALTAYATVEDRLRVLRCGFQIHLAKPVEPDELILAVAGLVGGSSKATGLAS